MLFAIASRDPVTDIFLRFLQNIGEYHFHRTPLVAACEGDLRAPFNSFMTEAIII